MIFALTYSGLLAESLGRRYLGAYPEQQVSPSCIHTEQVIFASIYSKVAGLRVHGICTVGFDLSTSPVSFQRAYQEDFVTRLTPEDYGRDVPVFELADPELVQKIKAFADEREPRVPNRGPW